MSNEEWEADVRSRLPAALIDETRRILERQRNLFEPHISYSALQDELASRGLSESYSDTHVYDRRIDDALGVVSLESDRAGRGMLSVLVVSKDGEKLGEPHDGFYVMARSMGRTGDSIEIRIKEFDLVRRFHRLVCMQ